MKSLLGLGFWDNIGRLLSYLPKITYFLYACIASLLDTFQLLIRRLIGLDPHYVVDGFTNTVILGVWKDYTAVSGDPLLEFILAILGIGETANRYSVLATTFWSFVIFGAIVLALSTIIAIIKSHYQEDSAKTSPTGYIYTALKSIFTFAITPLVVIGGFWLSSFLLKTLDDITAQEATSDIMKDIYGPNFMQYFRDSRGVDEENEYFSNYDCFGWGTASSSQTLSGMMFKTAAHGSNRLRTGDLKMKEFHTGAGDIIGDIFDFLTQGDLGYWWDVNGTFSHRPSNITTEADAIEWHAYQVDYAFANNLHRSTDQSFITPASIHTMQGDVSSWAFDGFGSAFGYWTPATSFTKFNVELVWCFYNLWSFNFIVGFGGISVMFGLMYSIILGLMSRLIKGIALFLIYPATLGLAPLDDWSSFKTWRKEFTQQILMGFGAIVGVNLFFLIFPFLQNIKFFDFVLLNYIVETIMAIAGLNMVKEFIKFLSGLIGGGDAAGTGDGLKEGVKKTLEKGVKGTLMMGKLAVKAATIVTPGGAFLKLGKAGMLASKAGAKASGMMAQAGAKKGAANKLGGLLDRAKAGDFDDHGDDFLSNARGSMFDAFKSEHKDDENQYRKDYKNLSDAERARQTEAEYIESRHGSAFEKSDDWKTIKDAAFEMDTDALSEKGAENIQAIIDANKLSAAELETNARAELDANYANADGTLRDDASKQIMRESMRDAAAAFLKAVTDGTKELTGANPAGIVELISGALKTSYKPEKAYGSEEEKKYGSYENYQREKRAAHTEQVKEGAWKLFGYGAGKGADKDKATGDKALNEVAEKTDAQTKVTEKLLKAIEENNSLLKNPRGGSSS